MVMQLHTHYGSGLFPAKMFRYLFSSLGQAVILLRRGLHNSVAVNNNNNYNNNNDDGNNAAPTYVLTKETICFMYK